MKAAEYLAAIKEKTGIVSDNAIAKKLELTRAAVSAVRTGRAGFGNEPALLIADILEIHPAIVVADCNAERAKTVMQLDMWREIAERFSEAGMSVMHGTTSAGKPRHA